MDIKTTIQDLKNFKLIKGEEMDSLGGRIFATICLLATMVGILALIVLLADVLKSGWTWLSIDFITGLPSILPEEAGIYPALIGSIYLMILTAFFTLPIGVGTAIYLEEYAKDGKLKRIIETNISNLAGVPSIVYGLLGLALFVRALQMGSSLIAGALTLTLLILPIVIVSSQEALKSVPNSLRRASYGLGATKWETIRNVVLPKALPGIMTGTILSLSRAVGETAPLIMIGAATSMFTTPDGLFSQFSALPLQIYGWIQEPVEAFQNEIAAAGIILLLALLLTMNSIAVLIRNRYER
ncbi:ABC-type phosphate transport system permease component [Methanonatronarchaeum thermophilum]|uniref:Phosphate transport system permease protein PstA n=2 Tax=Methanonatronarchaeum thermophilum TaxID=1927129 RepID=A0A1Y3GHY5_9EURY|nr:phosphate ABC transporter permease PstA [Methanonatronarchaeum thermophilum]OUJ18996.1 ABC-type phosphate transport system permease component [Methanonatronarchaeum thermophilum]